MVDSIDPHRWLERAFVDLRSAEANLNHDAQGLSQPICYSCQQAVEKALKAFLLLCSQPTTRSHDTVFLLGKCVGIDEDFLQWHDIAAVLNDYAVDARYPSDFPDRYTGDLAQDAVTLARQLIQFIADKFTTT